MSWTLGAIIKLLLTVVIAGGSVWLFIEVIRRRVKYIRLGAAAEWKRRTATASLTAKEVLLHQRLLKDVRSGILHLIYFYGFISLQLGAMDLMLKGLFHVRIMPWEGLYALFSMIQEWIVLAVFLAVCYGAYRRYGERIARLKRGIKASVVSWFIGSLMLTVLFTLAFERLHIDPSLRLSEKYAPLSSLLAAGLERIGIAAQGVGAAIGYEIFWWLHLLVLLSFLVYVPQSKHFHLLVAPINLWFRRPVQVGKLNSLDLEDEEAESFGVGQIEQFTQKQLLDLYACVECGRCTEVCPAASTGKILSPMHMITKLRDHLTEKGAAITSLSPWLPQGIWESPPWGEGDYTKGAHKMLNNQPCRSGRIQQRGGSEEGHGQRSDDEKTAYGTDITPTMEQQLHRWQWDEEGKAEEVALIGEVMTNEEIWACTTCRNCEEQCPVGNEHVDKIIDMRRHLVLMEGSMPADAQRALQNIERQSNPWGISRSQRGEWLAECKEKTGITVETLKERKLQGKETEYLLWVGSMGSFDSRSRKVLYELVRLLDHAKVNFAVLGVEEKSSGDTARRIGNEMLFQQLCQDNIAILDQYDISKIVTPCPHTYHTLKHEYVDFGFSPDIEVMHHTELLHRLLSSGKIKPTISLQEQITIHDSCYLGRYNGSYQTPRDILHQIPGVSIKEMTRSRENAMCCGAGGGLMWMEGDQGIRINYARTEQALKVNPTVISSACPYCLTMLEDGLKALREDGGVLAKDAAELLAESVLGPIS